MSEVGSLVLGVWVARLVLVALIGKAFVDGRTRLGVLAVALAVVGFAGVPRVNPALVTPYLAILDIGLVFAVIGGDIRLT